MQRSSTKTLLAYANAVFFKLTAFQLQGFAYADPVVLQRVKCLRTAILTSITNMCAIGTGLTEQAATQMIGHAPANQDVSELDIIYITNEVVLILVCTM